MGLFTKKYSTVLRSKILKDHLSEGKMSSSLSAFECYCVRLPPELIISLGLFFLCYLSLIHLVKPKERCAVAPRGAEAVTSLLSGCQNTTDRMRQKDIS